MRHEPRHPGSKVGAINFYRSWSYFCGFWGWKEKKTTHVQPINWRQLENVEISWLDYHDPFWACQAINWKALQNRLNMFKPEDVLKIAKSSVRNALELGTLEQFLQNHFNPGVPSKNHHFYWGEKNMPPPNVPPWHANYRELKTIKSQKTQEEFFTSLLTQKNLDKGPGPRTELTLEITTKFGVGVES